MLKNETNIFFFIFQYNGFDREINFSGVIKQILFLVEQSAIFNETLVNKLINI
jgi:hypothetical protein